MNVIASRDGTYIMAKTQIPQKIQVALWAKAAGRCEYRGCNEELIGDLIAGREDGKFGFIAHIVADSADGPRGDPVRSPALAKDLSNLMLLCAKHHKGVDVDYLADHPEDVLLEMKAEHEDRIAIVTGMAQERAAHVLRFAADIGQRDALVSTRSIFMAMPPDGILPRAERSISSWSDATMPIMKELLDRPAGQSEARLRPKSEGAHRAEGDKAAQRFRASAAATSHRTRPSSRRHCSGDGAPEMSRATDMALAARSAGNCIPRRRVFWAAGCDRSAQAGAQRNRHG